MKIIIHLFLSLLLFSCSQTPPEEAIENIMEEIEIAIEQKDNASIMKHVHESFRGNEHIDKTQLRKLLTVHFLRHNNINVVVTQMNIEHDPLQPYYAEMKGIAAVTGAENILPQDGRIYAIEGSWELHGDDWKLTELTWQ